MNLSIQFIQPRPRRFKRNYVWLLLNNLQVTQNYQGMLKNQREENMKRKGWSQLLEQVQVPNGTGPGVRVSVPYKHTTAMTNVPWKPL